MFIIYNVFLNQAAISSTKPILGLFVLISVHFLMNPNVAITVSSGASHRDASCISCRIHSDVSWNLLKKVYHIVTDNFVNLLHIS